MHVRGSLCGAKRTERTWDGDVADLVWVQQRVAEPSLTRARPSERSKERLPSMRRRKCNAGRAGG